MWKKILGLVLVFSLFALPAYAIDIQEEGVSLGEISHINVVGTRATATNEAGGVATITIPGTTAANIREIGFLPWDFIINDTVYMLPLTTSTTPGLEIENKAVSIVWDDGQATPVQVTFRVPVDYSSGGAFRGFFDSSAETTPSQVDYQVYIHTHNTAWDAAATDQTPVALAVDDGTPEVVTMAIATDFASLAAGQIVVVDVWRDDVADGTDDLEMYYLEFYYNAVDNN